MYWPKFLEIVPVSGSCPDDAGQSFFSLVETHEICYSIDLIATTRDTLMEAAHLLTKGSIIRLVESESAQYREVNMRFPHQV